ncbi:hypothetical protein JFQ93_001475 [Aeromonas sobria]|jgi:hypothetical protein|nr:hypothetical protein [Aeromonas sobria]
MIVKTKTALGVMAVLCSTSLWATDILSSSSSRAPRIPSVDNIQILGDFDQVGRPGATLSATYLYDDPNSLSEHNSTFVWWALQPGSVVTDCSSELAECTQLAEGIGNMDEAAQAPVLPLDGLPGVNLIDHLGKRVMLCVTPFNENGQMGRRDCATSMEVLSRPAEDHEVSLTGLNVIFNAPLTMATPLQGDYQFIDNFAHAEGASPWQWRNENNETFTHSANASGTATAATLPAFIPKNLDPRDRVKAEGHQLTLCVTPTDSEGESGDQQCAPLTSSVVAPDPANLAPALTALSFNGDAVVGQTLVGSIKGYQDAEGDLEDLAAEQLSAKWCWDNSKACLTDSGLALSLTENLQGQAVRFCVTPTAQTGTKVGPETCTAPVTVAPAPEEVLISVAIEHRDKDQSETITPADQLVAVALPLKGLSIDHFEHQWYLDDKPVDFDLGTIDMISAVDVVAADEGHLFKACVTPYLTPTEAAGIVCQSSTDKGMALVSESPRASSLMGAEEPLPVGDARQLTLQLKNLAGSAPAFPHAGKVVVEGNAQVGGSTSSINSQEWTFTLPTEPTWDGTLSLYVRDLSAEQVTLRVFIGPEESQSAAETFSLTFGSGQEPVGAGCRDGFIYDAEQDLTFSCPLTVDEADELGISVDGSNGEDIDGVGHQYIAKLRWDKANAFCSNLTAQGHSNWRLPTANAGTNPNNPHEGLTDGDSIGELNRLWYRMGGNHFGTEHGWPYHEYIWSKTAQPLADDNKLAVWMQFGGSTEFFDTDPLLGQGKALYATCVRDGR